MKSEHSNKGTFFPSVNVILAWKRLSIEFHRDFYIKKQFMVGLPTHVSFFSLDIGFRISVVGARYFKIVKLKGNEKKKKLGIFLHSLDLR